MKRHFLVDMHGSPTFLRISNTNHESQKLSSNRDKLHKLELNDFSPEFSILHPSPFAPELNNPFGLLSGFVGDAIKHDFFNSFRSLWGTVDTCTAFSSTSQMWRWLRYTYLLVVNLKRGQHHTEQESQ